MSNHPAADHLIERAERLAPGDATGHSFQLGCLQEALRRMDELGLTPAQYMKMRTGDTGDAGDIRATSGFEASPVADREPGTTGDGEVPA